MRTSAQATDAPVRAVGMRFGEIHLRNSEGNVAVVRAGRQKTPRPSLP